MKKLILTAFILAFAACGSKSADTGKNVRVGLPGNPTTMDPYYKLDGQSVRVMYHIYDGLVVRLPNGEIIPVLAESYQQTSPTEYVFKLKKGIVFHNGSPFNAEDVQYSFKRLKESPAMASYVSLLKQVDIIDEYTVKFILEKPFAPFIAVIAMENIVILDKETVSADLEKARTNPVGTGPFKFVEWVLDDRVVLEANKNYHMGAPRIDKLIFNVVVEPSSRSISLEAGELQIAYGLDVADYKNITDDSKLDAILEQQATVMHLVGNYKRPFWNDLKIRQAIDKAINKEGILQLVLPEGIKGKVATSFVPDGVFGKTAFPVNPRDIEGAKKLLAESPLGKNLKLSIVVPADYRKRLAELIQANLKEIGIDLTIDVREWGAYLQAGSRGEYDLSLFGWISSTMDADLSMSPKLHSKNSGVGGNYSFLTNAGLDKYLDDARVEINPEKRKEYYAAAQKIIYDNTLVIPLYYSTELVGKSKKVQGFGFSPTFAHRLHDLTLAQ